jgi:dTMP kinase
MRGKFIVIDGPDGAGLSTQAELLRDWIVEQGKPAILTKEPTTGPIGGIIRAVLDGEWKLPPYELQLLFVADRAHHLAHVIEPALRAGKIVICDRYILSTLAFGVPDVSEKLLKEMNAGFRKPDLTIFLDVPPAVSLKRIRKSRVHLELFEQSARLAHVRKNFLRLRNHFKPTVIINGNRLKEVVRADIWNKVRPLIFKVK